MIENAEIINAGTEVVKVEELEENQNSIKNESRFPETITLVSSQPFTISIQQSQKTITNKSKKCVNIGSRLKCISISYD